MSAWARGETRISWSAGGGLILEVGRDVMLIDAPLGVVDAVRPVAARVRAVICTTGRIQAIGGLLPLLSALEPHRPPDAALQIHLPLGEERAAGVIETWERYWPDRYPLVVDLVRPGGTFDIGALEVETFPIRVGEVGWHDRGVDTLIGVGLRLRTADLTAAIILGAAPSPALARRCVDVDLAVIEVGVEPWPRTDHPWRLRSDEAVEIGAGARELWLVGDDGAELGAPEN